MNNEPAPSRSTSTPRPARHRSARADENSSEIVPFSKTYCTSVTVLRASRIAVSMAGKNSSPFWRSSTRLPGRMGAGGGLDGRIEGRLAPGDLGQLARRDDRRASGQHCQAHHDWDQAMHPDQATHALQISKRRAIGYIRAQGGT